MRSLRFVDVLNIIISTLEDDVAAWAQKIEHFLGRQYRQSREPASRRRLKISPNTFKPGWLGGAPTSVMVARAAGQCHEGQDRVALHRYSEGKSKLLRWAPFRS